jgi:hypothetical protein
MSSLDHTAAHTTNFVLGEQGTHFGNSIDRTLTTGSAAAGRAKSGCSLKAGPARQYPLVAFPARSSGLDVIKERRMTAAQQVQSAMDS